MVWTFVLAAFFMDACQGARLQETRPLMGTAVEVIAEGPAQPALRAAAEESFREMNRLSDMMNHYDPRSVVSAINDAAGLHPVPVPAELKQVFAMAQRVSRRSRGAFDITVGGLRGWSFRQDDPRMPEAAAIARQLPLVNWKDLVVDEKSNSAFLRKAGMRVDLGGIAKLYILEAGIRLLGRPGVERAMLNGGGDVVAFGRPGVPPWRVGIRDPAAPEKLLGLVEITRGFVASSGDYERYFIRDGERYHHVLDPRTGFPSRGPRGVTLVSERLEAVNGLGVVIMVLGKTEGMRLVKQTRGLDALIVDRDGSTWLSAGMRARLRRN